jgi:hypothetical protein
LKNSAHPSTELRANGISLEITRQFPFMLSQVEACKLFFNSLFTSGLSSFCFLHPAQAFLNSTPQRLGRERCAVAQSAELGPGDLLIHSPAETAVGGDLQRVLTHAGLD